MNDLDNDVAAFEKEVDERLLVSSPYSSTILEARALVKSIHDGPSEGGGYLAWTGDLLQEAEFNIARLTEYLAMEEAKADAKSSFSKDKFKQRVSQMKQIVRKDFGLTKEKFTNSEIEDEVSVRLAAVEDSVNLRYAEYRALRNLVDSLQRIMLCFTHRINELQSEKRFKA